MLTKRLKHALETKKSAMNDLNKLLADNEGVLLTFSVLLYTFVAYRHTN